MLLSCRTKTPAPAATGRAGFNLIELLVTLSILSVLLGLLLPAVQKVRAAAARIQCSNNLKQLSLAFHTAADANQGLMPPGIGTYNGGNAYGTGLFHILPYIEQGALYKGANANGVAARAIKLFTCPAAPTGATTGVVPDNQGNPWGLSSYAGNTQVFCYVDANGHLLDPQGRPNLFTTFGDGTTNTILFAEKYPRCTNAIFTEGGSLWAYDVTQGWVEPLHPAFAVSWQTYSIGPASMFQVRPRSNDCDPTLASTAHQTMPVAMVDGSVRQVSAGISGATWWAACTPNGGEVLGNDWER